MAASQAWGRDEWVRFALGHVAWRGPEQKSLAIKIGEACHDAQQRGESTCIMHETARITGARCWCQGCRS